MTTNPELTNTELIALVKDYHDVTPPLAELISRFEQAQKENDAIAFGNWLKTFEPLTKENGQWVLESQISTEQLYSAFKRDSKPSKTDNMNEKLKPCPFCGSDEVKIPSQKTKDGFYKVIHVNSFCPVTMNHVGFNELKQKWNTRPSFDVEEVVKAVKSITHNFGRPECDISQSELRTALTQLTKKAR